MPTIDRYDRVMTPAELDQELNRPLRRIVMLGGIALTLTGLAYEIGEKSDYKTGIPLFLAGTGAILFSGWWKSRRQAANEPIATEERGQATVFDSNQHDFIHSVMTDIARLPETDEYPDR